MKKSIAFFFVIVILFSLPSFVCAAEDAAPYEVAIKSVKMTQGSNRLTYQIAFRSESSADIAEISYLVDYYNKFNEQQYIQTIAEGYLTENGFSPSVNLKPGKTVTIKNETYVFTKDQPVSKIKVAVCGYRYKNGNSVTIPDSHLYWFDSANGYERKPSVYKAYKEPSQSVLNKRDIVWFGMETLNIYSYIKTKYAHSAEPGIYLTAVNDGSLAQKSGLKVKDIIYGIDELYWKDEPFCIEYGKARLAEGKTIVIHVLRAGEKIDLEIDKNGEIPKEEVTPEITEVPVSPTPAPKENSKPTPVPETADKLPTGVPLNRYGRLVRAANFRSGPSVDSPIVGESVNAGDYVYLIINEQNAQNEIWTKVNINGTEGYIKSEHIYAISEEESTEYNQIQSSPAPIYILLPAS